MFAAKSFVVGNKAFCIVRVNNKVYLNGESVSSLQALKQQIISNAENLQDATMVRDILSFCTSGGSSNLPNCSQSSCCRHERNNRSKECMDGKTGYALFYLDDPEFSHVSLSISNYIERRLTEIETEYIRKVVRECWT